GGSGDPTPSDRGLLIVARLVWLMGAQARVPVLLEGDARLAASGRSSRWSMVTEECSGSLPRVVKAMRADVSRATRETKSGVAASSNGTATAPSSRQAQKEAIHSALLGPQSRTRSPVRMPLWRSS